MQCPNCETENRDGAKFCDECGFPLAGNVSRHSRAEGEDAGESVAKEDPSGEVEEVSTQQADSGIDVETWAYDELHDDHIAEAATKVIGPVDETPQDELPESAFDQQRTDVIDYEPAPFVNDFTMQMPRIENAQQEPNRDFRASSDVPQKKGKKIAIAVVIALVVIAVAAAAATYVMGMWGGKPLPDVTGMTEADATTVLAEDGFKVRSTQVKSDDTEGLVLIMDPGAGTREPEGTEVVIHVSTARSIPQITGQKRDAAAAQLAEAGYENVKYVTERSDGEEGIVLSVAPEEGSRTKSTAEVVVTVSEAYKVPSIDGMGLDAAIAAINEAGLYATVVYVDTDQYYDGTILGTIPEAGVKVAGGDWVTISVSRSRGVELVALTQSLFAPGNTVTIGGVSYEIESLISATYQGDNVVSYSATGRPKIMFFGETLYASASQTLTGTVVYSASNEVLSIT